MNKFRYTVLAGALILLGGAGYTIATADQPYVPATRAIIGQCDGASKLVIGRIVASENNSRPGNRTADEALRTWIRDVRPDLKESDFVRTHATDEFVQFEKLEGGRSVITVDFVKNGDTWVKSSEGSCVKGGQP
ncbi:MAG TPA: hypothetical protein VGB83_10840 [Actinomycetota bacterium]